MVVQHNITAMNANRMLGITTNAQAKSTEKLSSGYKINRAADDAAGLAISEKMRRQIRGLTQASANAQDGISAVQTAEGALTEVHDMLQRMNELSIKAGNGTMSESDRQSIQEEIDQLITEIDRVSETTKFNETYLLKGEGKSSASKASIGAAIKNSAAGTITSVDGSVNKAKGNIYSGTVTSTLAAHTEDVATIKYKDAEGNVKERDVTIEVGVDDKATAANLAKAISNDSVLSKIFKTSVDKAGNVSIESKLNGNKTDDTKNAVESITFAKSSAGALNTTFAVTGTPVAATRESYEVVLATGDNDAEDALGKFETGSSITIDGKTYTFDAAKAAGNTADSFGTLQELQDLLGDGYEVSLTVSAIEEDTTTPSPSKPIIQTLDAAALGTEKINSKDAADLFTDIVDAHSGTDYLLKAGSVTATLNITKKADAVQETDALNFSLQVGADTTEENKINVSIESMSAKSLGIDGVLVTGSNSANADEAVNTIADAIAKVSKQRSVLGAVQNRLEHTINNLDNVVENTTSAEAQIRDTDIATEMVKYSNNSILQQAGTSMLSQANQSNQLALSLLG